MPLDPHHGSKEARDMMLCPGGWHGRTDMSVLCVSGADMYK
jgi:hypothetical protein